MKIVIVGAGAAGLVTAKVLRGCGFDVAVIERTPDIGGVWSATRRYPGLRTQNTKRTYRFSDHMMPAGYPRWPSGKQMQDYLYSYVDRFDLRDAIRLHTEVIEAAPDSARGWTVTVRAVTGEYETIPCDHLVVANGVFSDPAVPEYPGVDEHRAAGYQLCHASQLLDLDIARDKSVVVVGYGKSACDVAAALSDVAACTSVVARRLLWKMPPSLGHLMDFEQLELNRLGEAGFAYIEPTWFDRFLHGPARLARDAVFDIIQAIVIRQLRLRTLGLLPNGRFEEISESTESLVTKGFFEKVASRAICVHRDATITRLSATGSAELSTGAVIPADLVVCATGFQQRVPFLDAGTQHRLIDERGNLQLYRQILPLGIRDLSFAGYNSSGISMLSAEVGAWWTAGLLTGRFSVPSQELQRAQVSARLAWMEERTNGHHAHGAVVTPFSVRNIDEMLTDLGVNVGVFTRAMQWIGTVRPDSYRKPLGRLANDISLSSAVDRSARPYPTAGSRWAS
jgi:dimethylaniline monooxygenase (N-oxide forming)